MTRGGWEKELQKKLDKAGMTEADLSAKSQAYIAAKWAHEGAMPRLNQCAPMRCRAPTGPIRQEAKRISCT